MAQPYRLTTGTAILRISDGATIPADPGNRDYQDFVEWLALGNTPDPVAVPPINQSAQLAARTAFRAKALSGKGQVLAAYMLLNPEGP